MKSKCIVGVFVLVVLGFSLAWGAVAAFGAASPPDKLGMVLSRDSHPIEIPIAGGGMFAGELTITDVDTVNGVLCVMAQLEGALADKSGNTAIMAQPFLIPISKIKAVPDIGTDNCVSLVLQGNNLLLQLNLLGLNVLLQTPQIDLTAYVPNGTPICDILHSGVNFADSILTHPDMIIELLRRALGFV